MTDEPMEPEAVIDPWSTEDAEAVRSTRNQLLADTDWAVLPDAPAQRSLASRGALWFYRQQLRDITDRFATPADVVWPEPPVI
jgi:hypothetical protein